MINRIAKGVYPCFESELKCLQTLVNFKKGEFYKIEGFGTSKGTNEEVLDVWYIQDLSNHHIKFPVKKETMEIMIDTNKIIHYYKN